MTQPPRQETAADPAAGSGADDPFGTGTIRERVLAAWAASPARFREDANAEEDLVHGSYRDRLLVELAQNAADAAARAGVAGVLRLSFVDGELRAANTGAPLDAAGVAALATLRASAKRGGDTVGRFGVGFAAVLAVTDAPAVRSTAGGVRFSAERTRAEAAARPELRAELAERGGQVPALRLPWPEPGRPPDGFDTEVRLPLRPGAESVLAAAFAAADPSLLLALPALWRVELGDRVLFRADRGRDVVLGDLRVGDLLAGDLSAGDLSAGDRAADGRTRWRVRTTTGMLPGDLLAGRPTEDRGRPGWSLTWAVPVDGDDLPAPLPGGRVVYAPTPTDEPLSVPARLIGTFPLGPDRRHVAPGPITDLLIARAATAYAELVADLPAQPRLLGLVPAPRLAAAPLDAALGEAIRATLRQTAWLPLAGGSGTDQAPPPVEASVGVAAAPAAGSAAEPPAGSAAVGPARRIAPAGAVVVDAATEPLVSALVEVVPALLPAAWSGRQHAAALGMLGVRRLSTADVVDLVSGVDRPPVWWRDLYSGLADAPDREALAALPVPLADGRTVTGVRGLLLPDAGLPAAAASGLGLRVVHPDAVHPLLARLGATPATPYAALTDERVRAAVRESYAHDDPAAIADAVLALVWAAAPAVEAEPWLAELALPGADGDWYPAGELSLPGSPLAEVLAADAPVELVAAQLVDRWGADVLRAVGVLYTFGILRVPDVPIDIDALQDCDELDGPDWGGAADPAGRETAAALSYLDGIEDWYDAILGVLPDQPVPPRLIELVAVRDLELVSDAGWDRALPLLAALPGVAAPAIAVLDDSSRVEVPSYTRWWLAAHPVLGGQRPDRSRLPSAGDLAGLYDPAAGDPALLEFAGGLASIDDVLGHPDRAIDLLDRLADPDRQVQPDILRDLYARLAFALDGCEVRPPARVRVAPTSVVDSAGVVVLDAPHLLPLLGSRPVVPAGGAAGAVADLLELPFASEITGGVVESTPVRRARWADLPGAALAAERCGASAPPDADVAVHSGLTVAGVVPVPWWPAGDTDHVDAAAGPAALGRALAWRLDRWGARAAAAEALAEPDDPTRLRAEDAAE